MSGKNNWSSDNPWAAGDDSGWGSGQGNIGWDDGKKDTRNDGWGEQSSETQGGAWGTQSDWSSDVQQTDTRLPQSPADDWGSGDMVPAKNAALRSTRLRDKSGAVAVQTDGIRFGKGTVQVGKAQELQSNRMQVRRGFLSAWFQSLIYGVPFYTGDTRNTFNLYPLDDDDGGLDLARQHCIMVTFFGPSDSGMISSGQIMEVHGKFGPDRSFYASNIINRTNGTSVRISAGMPGNAVRIITLLVLGVLAYLLLGLDFGGGGNLAAPVFGNVNWSELLVTAAILIALLVFALKKLRNPMMRFKMFLRKGALLLGIILVMMVLPELGAILLIIWLLWMILF